MWLADLARCHTNSLPCTVRVHAVRVRQPTLLRHYDFLIVMYHFGNTSADPYDNPAADHLGESVSDFGPTVAARRHRSKMLRLSSLDVILGPRVGLL